jgi:hypothetical protein
MYCITTRDYVDVYDWNTDEFITRIPSKSPRTVLVSSDCKFVFTRNYMSIDRVCLETNELVSVPGLFVDMFLSPNDEFLFALSINEENQYGDAFADLVMIRTDDLSTRTIKTISKIVKLLEMSPDSKTVYYGWSRNIVALNLETRKSVDHLNMTMVSTSKIDNTVVYANSESVVIQTGTRNIVVQGKSCPIAVLCDGSAIVATDTTELVVMSTETGDELFRIEVAENVYAIVPSPVSQRVLVMTVSRILIVDMLSGEVTELMSSCGITSVSSSGPYLGNVLL